MKPRQNGFTLIEVLIAMLVLSIGLLGIAALQATGLRSSHSATLRSQATQLAYDMADRMRANLAGYEGGAYNNITPGGSPTSCLSNSCTPQQMAEYDVWEWNETIARELPRGVGVVCLDATANDGGDANNDGSVAASEYACGNSGNLFAVKLWWVDEFGVDDQGAPDEVIKRFATEFQP